MNKKIFVLIVLFTLFLSGCKSKPITQQDNKKTTVPEVSVPQTYEEWVAKNNTSKKTSNQNSKVYNKYPSRSSSSQPIKKTLMGEKIPDWVYQNSAPSDDYYDALYKSSNFIFYTYQDCPKGRKLQSDIENAIRNAGVSNLFVMKRLYPPKTMSCSKFREKFAPDQVNTIFEQRQKGVPDSQKVYYQSSDGYFCIPYGKNGVIPEGACHCSVNYFLEKCNNNGNVCIVNPRKHRLISIQPNEEILTAKLRELKNNW